MVCGLRANKIKVIKLIISYTLLSKLFCLLYYVQGDIHSVQCINLILISRRVYKTLISKLHVYEKIIILLIFVFVSFLK